MSRDPSAWLGKIEPEKPRNARLWDGTAGEAAITPAEIRNAATLDDARRGTGMNPHLAHREDTRAAMVKGREDRERREAKAVPVDPDDLNADVPSQARRLDVLRAALARGDEPEEIRAAWPTWWASGKSTNTERMWCRDRAALRAEQAPVVAPEQPMPKANPSAPTPNDLRAYLLAHGPTDRAVILDEVGYRKSYKNEATARTMLNKALRIVGAVNNGARFGPLWIPNEDGTPMGVDAQQASALRVAPQDLDEARKILSDHVMCRHEHVEIEPDDADLVNRYELAIRALREAQDAHKAARNALFDRLKK